MIDLDNGPQIASSPAQFMSRLVDFSDQYQLPLDLAYYPPYHSKYNPIERCWGVLENYWNGTLLSSIPTALEWAKRMTWRGESIGDDIVIGSQEISASDSVAIDLIMSSWTHAIWNFATRIANIASHLNTFTVLDDGDEDTLCGGAEFDWFLADLVVDLLSDLSPDEVITAI